MKKSIGIIFGCCLLMACETNVEEETQPVVAICDTTISFAQQVQPIINTNCISCHGGSQFPDLRTYEGVSNNAARVSGQVVSRRMPLGGSLTENEIETIRCWIESGALNN
ncbi:cytochrome c [Aquimarina sp. SS2-1]|uniref:cytochrome c n=1 Tax=Aquimarina besae TaxID=3342247 RepID=UPI00366B087D